MYAFDGIRRTHRRPPSLEIKGCTFKYFVNKLNSLIQVETNNFGYMGQAADGNMDDAFLSYYGEDRGAKITIRDSHFYNNAFCKGMIYYS